MSHKYIMGNRAGFFPHEMEVMRSMGKMKNIKKSTQRN